MTQKEQLIEIKSDLRVMAEKNLQLAADLSTFMNKQDLFNQRILDIVETNPLTKKTGIVEDVNNLKYEVELMKTQGKVTAGKISIGVFIISLIGGLAYKVINLLD